MPELAEPPVAPSEQSDNDALKASFNTALQGQTGVDPKAATDDTPEPGAQPVLKPAKPATAAPAATPAAEESIVPEQFTTTPKDEPKPDPTEILTAEERGQLVAKLGGKAQESFNRLETASKAKVAALQAKLDEMTRKAETAPAGPSKEHEEALRAASERAAKLEEQLERAAFAESPRFQKFGSEITAELGTAKGYLEGTQISPAVLDLAASQAGQARLKTLRDAGMDSETIAAVGPHLARADAIRRERDGALDSWKTDHAREMEQHQAQQAQQKAALERQEKEVWDKVAAEMRGKHPAFTKVDGKDKWNALVDQNEKLSEDFAMGRMPLDELFRLGREGVAARTIKLMNDELVVKVNALTEEVGRLRAAQPGTGHTNTSTTPAKPMNETEEHKAAFNRGLEQVRGGQ